MPRIVLDQSATLHKGVFYRFTVPFEDRPVVETPTAEWIVVPRNPTGEELRSQGKETWLYIDDRPDFDSSFEIKGCPADPSHVTFSYYTKIAGESFRGRVSPIIAAANGLVVVISDALKQRMESLKVSGARTDAMRVTDHYTDAPVKGFWALQFVGKVKRRLPKFVDAPNSCPYCGKSKIICESCGYWNLRCLHCGKQMVILDSAHGGQSDKRIPYEHGCNWRIIDGNSWDGSDVLGGSSSTYASKRFIDWLLRIHAAPFYAEPVFFCVDGMSDQQKKWFDDLQKPFEA